MPVYFVCFIPSVNICSKKSQCNVCWSSVKAEYRNKATRVCLIANKLYLSPADRIVLTSPEPDKALSAHSDWILEIEKTCKDVQRKFLDDLLEEECSLCVTRQEKEAKKANFKSHGTPNYGAVARRCNFPKYKGI